MNGKKLNQCFFLLTCIFTITFIFVLEDSNNYTQFFSVYIPGLMIMYVIFIFHKYICNNQIEDFNPDNIENNIIDRTIHIRPAEINTRTTTENDIENNIDFRNIQNYINNNNRMLDTPFFINSNKNIQIIPIIINEDLSDICCICLDNICHTDKVCHINDCKKHIYHLECAQIYKNNNFYICPLCNE